MAKKNYLLDTNILLQDPYSIHGFDDNNVLVCGTTLQELDSKKRAPGELGYNAREACRIIDSLREKGNLVEGVPLSAGGMLIVEPNGVDKNSLPAGFSIEVADNRIISSAIYLNKNRCRDSHVILVTNDISMRVNASVCGLKVEGYRNDHVDKEKSGYTGHVAIELPEKDDSLIDEVYSKKRISASLVPDGDHLIENEFVTLQCGKHSALTIHREGMLHKIRDYKLFGGVSPKNAMQSYAIHALMAPVDDIPLVILLGPAGTAKTFLSLAAGLSQTCTGFGRDDSDYQRIMLCRPNVATEESFGYLPGDIRDKTNFLLNNYYDNIFTLLRGKDKREDPAQIRMQIDDMLDSGILEISPLNWIRGRSIPDSFIICDEAQNASRSLVRDIISRAGTGSKVICAGDIEQVDTPNLDARNNGLIAALEMMKGEASAIVRFEERHCVRSKLAELTIRQMKW